MKTKKFVENMRALITTEKQWIASKIANEEYTEANNTQQFIRGIEYSLEILAIEKNKQKNKKDSTLFVEVDEKLKQAKKAAKKDMANGKAI